MAEYLVDHPPRIRQFRQPRRATPSGVVVVHTAESFPDESGPDDGALNVARFIENRTNYGSYHDLADSDSWLRLVPYDAEAFGDGTGSNPHAYHVSAATQAAKWDQLGDEWVDGCVRNMAKAAANYAGWVKAERGVTIPARRISRAQSDDRVPGFISHAQRDPARRTDPGAGFPWAKFLTYYTAEMTGNEEWFDMFDNEKEFKAAVVAANRPMALRIERLFGHVLRGQGVAQKDIDAILAELAEAEEQA